MKSFRFLLVSLLSMVLVSVALSATHQELLEKRTATSKTFDNSDGTFTLQMSTSPIHYQDARGSWQEVNTSVVSQKGSYEWGCTQNGLKSFFSSNSSSGVRVEAQPDFWLNLRPSGLFLQFPNGVVEKYEDCKAVPPEVRGNKVLYKGIYTFVDQAYEVESFGLRLQFTINGVSQAQREQFAKAEYLKFTFHLERPENVGVWQGNREFKKVFTGSQLELRNGENKEAFSFEALRVQGRADVSFALKYAVEHVGSETQLSVLVPSRLLLRQGNNFPLTIDSQINLVVPNDDRHCAVPYQNIYKGITQSWVTIRGSGGQCGSYHYNVDYVNWFRSAFQWNWTTPQIPDNATITSVGLSFRAQTGSSYPEENYDFYALSLVDITQTYWDTYPDQLWGAIYSANYIGAKRIEYHPLEPYAFPDIGPNATQVFRDQLTSHYFAIGMKRADEDTSTDAIATFVGANSATLSVTFTAPFVRYVIQNELWEGRQPHKVDVERVKVENVWVQSPATFWWEPTTTKSLDALQSFTFNGNPYYFCSWTDGGSRAHDITVGNVDATDAAYFKRPPNLSGYHMGNNWYHIDWDWLGPPYEERPPHFSEFSVYYLNRSELLGTTGGNSWTHNPYLPLATPELYHSYQIEAWMDGPNVVLSNKVRLQPVPPGDPLVAHSHDSLATGYPNGQKVVLDRKDRLHVVFTSSDTVYYTTSNKKAKKWSTPVSVGLGKFPAIAMDSKDDPHVLWVSGTQVLASQLLGEVWTTPFSLYSQPLAQTIEAPSFVINTANDSGYAAWTLVAAESSVVSLASFVPGDTTAPVSVQNVDVGAGTPFASPSLALDPTGQVLISWSREGEVYFEEQGGTRLNLSQSSELSIHPVVDAYGDRVSVTYQERDSSGAFKIYRVLKEDGVWGVPQPINLFSGNALFPATAGASQVAFSSDVAGRRDIYWHGEYEDGGVIYGTTLSASSEGEHNYPSVALDNDWPKATLHGIWTAGPGDPIKVKSISIEVPPVPLVFVDPGKAAPSSHTIQREGAVTYGSQPYLTADYHPQKLIYRFSGLNPNKRYRLGATYYFEKPGETWRMRLVVDGRDGMRTRIPSGERVDDSNWVPASVYQDGVIDVEITPDAGDFALANEIALYEFNRGSGGPQTDETGPIAELPLTYALGQGFPNPFKDKATIAYQLPEETSVSLKVFNVTGQVVRELASGKQKPGYYNAVWDGKDGSGRSVSSGIYFYRLDAGGFSMTNKLVVVR